MQKVVVVGGGISGLASAYLIQQEVREQNLALEVIVVEKEARLGGKIWSRHEDGYLCEWGPNGFLTNKPQTLQLCAKLGLSEKLLRSNDNARKRFVYAQGRLHQLPHTQLEFLSCSLLTPLAKLRIALEFFIPQRKSLADESLAAFAQRRLGKEALSKLIAPMASGIFAGNPATMSLQGCFPRIFQLEQEYGSLLKAMLKLAKKHRQAAKAGEVVAGPAGPGGVLTSFNDGIQVLTDSLAAAVGEDNIIRGAVISNIVQRADQRFELSINDEQLVADQLIMATPAYASASLLESLDVELSQLLNRIDYAPLVLVCLGYAEEKILNKLNGFGYLLASGEEFQVLGTLWDSSIFIQRAPSGKVLLRTMLGGAANQEIMEHSDIALQQIVENSVKSILGIECAPEMIRVYRHSQAIPAYRLGHPALVKQIMERVATHPNLLVTGNAFQGVGINDCVAAAYAVSQQVIAKLNRQP